MIPASRRELIRKGVHTAGLLFIPLLYYSEKIVLGIIGFFFIVYPIIEWGLIKGWHIPLISALTKYSKRPDEQKLGFAWPAYFLAIGVMFSLIFFDRRIAALAIFHVCLGDTVAAVSGRCWGKTRLFFNRRKTWVGSLAYLLVTFVGGLYWLPPAQALLLATVGAAVESLPFKNLDNLLIPVVVSLMGSRLL